jgi:hypothetical protein
VGPAIAPVRKPLASFKRRQNIGAQGRNRTTDTVIFSHVEAVDRAGFSPTLNP